MKLSCPSCSAKYSIADEKVHDRLAKIRCRKCSATIIIDGKVQPPHVYTSEGQHGGGAEAAPAGAEGGDIGPGEYSVDFGDNDQRTMSLDQIVQAYRAGQVTNDTYVWAEGMGDWQPVSGVAEIQDAFRNAGASSPPRAPSEPPRVAAARTGAGRGSATDLFGAIETAGSEEDVTTSAPHAPPAAAAAGVATGARNESSVLFSLSALTAGAPAAAPVAAVAAPAIMASGGAPAGGLAAAPAVDDSGLIDLKALTASAGDMPAVSPFQVAHAPLGMGAPLGGISHHVSTTTDLDVPMQRPSSNKNAILIIGGFIGMGAIIAAAIVATSGSKEDDAAAAGASAALANPTPTVTATAPPPATTEAVTAKPPATGTSATEEKKPEEKVATKTPTRSYRPKKSGSSSKAAAEEEESTPAPTKTTSSKSSSSDEEAPAPKKKAASSQCNCAPSDLMCAMRCAAGHH